MISREDILKILEASANAPSGSNSQPWRFEFKNDALTIFALPEKDHPILNYRYRGTWVAHGALIENIKISSAALGHRADIQIFPNAANPNMTARIVFEEGSPSEEALFRTIPRRATNRKSYDIAPLDSEQKKYLESSTEEVGGGVEVRFTENRERIMRLGRAVAANEIITLENEKTHKLFFDEIVWDKTEEANRQMGLYLKTMELKPPQELALKLFRLWPVMRVLNKIGIAKGIAKGNAKNYARAPLIGAVVVRDDDRDFLTAGRTIERIWLKATQLGFGFHLMTGTMFFWQRIALGGSGDFSTAHQKLIKSEYEAIKSAFGVESGIVAAVFRVGKSEGPSARSSKRKPEIRWG